MADRDGKICCSATLIATGADLDPDRVTELLKLTPDQTWRRGERKSFTRADGTVRQFDSVYADGGWKCFLTNDIADEALEAQMEKCLLVLESRADSLRKLSEQRYDLELNCYEGSTCSVGLTLTKDTLAQLAKLHLDLDISIYR